MKAVTTLWNVLQEKGLLYKGQHEGWYSVPDETFLTDKQVVDRPRTDGSGVDKVRTAHCSEQTIQRELTAFH